MTKIDTAYRRRLLNYVFDFVSFDLLKEFVCLPVAKDPASYHQDFAGIYSHAMREFVILPES